MKIRKNEKKTREETGRKDKTPQGQIRRAEGKKREETRRAQKER